MESLIKAILLWQTKGTGKRARGWSRGRHKPIILTRLSAFIRGFRILVRRRHKRTVYFGDPKEIILKLKYYKIYNNCYTSLEATETRISQRRKIKHISYHVVSEFFNSITSNMYPIHSQVSSEFEDFITISTSKNMILSNMNNSNLLNKMMLRTENNCNVIELSCIHQTIFFLNGINRNQTYCFPVVCKVR